MKYDLILAGTGLANGLIAWRLRQLRPELRVLCIEEQPSIGGNHTWSFHEGDLNAAQREWIAPLVVHKWSSYEVHFPARSRRLASGYASITSERFVQVIGAALGDDVRTGQTIAQVHPHSVLLASGECLKASAVIDGRGVRDSEHMVLGRQAFLGQLLQLTAPHGLESPIIMDARVAQGDGYRFVYVLPFTPDTVLVEDTHYVDRHALCAEQLRAHISEYVREQGWTVSACLREEEGVLPITLAGDFSRFWPEEDGQPRAGLRAGLFHCTTGYSLPHAVRVADWIVQQRDLDAESLAKGMRAFAYRAWRQQRFYRLLNRTLFLAGRPQDRWQVMQRFYGLSEDLIRRFYAGNSSTCDKLRVVSGKPPVPIKQAIDAMRRYLPSHYENRE
ncbi:MULTISPECIES: lycopene beta-cyclase CrtY [unclassified Pseudomonas]|uniref:lycopene beta-cyclase CrtY n=1 Tax=unclassified Pseudomonas TaxID=196821 RepID=UPI0025DC7761|nr:MULTISPECIES: lycopene beta-cyclase CrtY [unclassified Pseudomonas]